MSAPIRLEASFPAPLLTCNQLRAVMPKLPVQDATRYLPHLCAAFEEFDIASPVRCAAALAQMAHESAELRRWEENLRYSAGGLQRTWPKRFPAPIAPRYAYKPQPIANRAYGGRMGNGPESSGDGWRYRGRGPIMLTGRDNYRDYGDRLGLPLEASPDLAALPEHGFRIFGSYWKGRRLWEPADAGDLVELTRRVNGGTIGLEERRRYWVRALDVLAARPGEDGARVG
jgi:putative chitinase